MRTAKLSTFAALTLAACNQTACTGDDTDDTSSVITCPEPDSGVTPVGFIEEACCARDPEVELGVGEGCHEPLSEEGCVTMVHGPQGGWHIWFSFQTTTFRNVVSYEIDIVDVESGESLLKDDADSARVAVLATEDECVHTYPGVFGYLNQLSNLPDYTPTSTPPELLCHKELELSITVTDTDGREITVTERALASGDPNKDADICSPLPGCEDSPPMDTGELLDDSATEPVDECA